MMVEKDLNIYSHMATSAAVLSEPVFFSTNPPPTIQALDSLVVADTLIHDTYDGENVNNILIKPWVMELIKISRDSIMKEATIYLKIMDGVIENGEQFIQGSYSSVRSLYTYFFLSFL